jgi:uncharacterized membrane protein YoaT (DUF817 family)
MKPYVPKPPSPDPVRNQGGRSKRSAFVRRYGPGQLWVFGREQALSCIFPAAIFLTLALSRYWPIPFLHRYDLILLVLVAVQAGMVRSGLETRDELKVICVFHLIGLVLELFKVRHGSWSYPEEAWTKVGGVPLYSGFMYASVASYICQAWRRLHLNMEEWPPQIPVVVLGAAIYLNFFTHHYIPDLRWYLLAAVFAVFWRTRVSFSLRGETYRMPLVLSFFLIGFFIWLAENISTFLGAWEYPDQHARWHPVGLGKISSWYLLVMISMMIVTQLKRVKSGRRPEHPS